MGCFGGDDSRVHDEVRSYKRRHCTDLICLCLFTLFWIFLLVVAIFAFVVGDPLRLIYGVDSFGNVCGRKNFRTDDRLVYSGIDMTDRPYVFFLNLNDLKSSLSICVKMCPNETLQSDAEVELFYQRTGASLCRYDYEFGPSSSRNRVSSADTSKGVGPCPSYPVLPSRPILNRCIPNNIAALGNKVISSIYGYFNSFDTLKQIVGDLVVSWREVFVMTCFSVFLTLIVVFLIHFFANLCAFILLFVVSVSLLLLTGVMWWTYVDVRFELNNQLSKYHIYLDESLRNERTFLALSIITTIITVILVLICLVMRKRVKLVAALFNEAAACIRAMPGLLFQPFWTFLVLAAFVVFWLAVILALATADFGNKTDTQLQAQGRRPSSSGDFSFGQSDVSILTTIRYNQTSWVKYMWWYALIGFFWSVEFIIGCEQMVIAGAVGTWYFTRDRSNLPCPLGRSIRRLFLFHMGSVAFGAFLITLLKVPRVILVFVQQKLKKHEDWGIIRAILYCCHCCLWVLENFLQYLNRNAYTVTAIRGTSFCTSAQVAFSTIASNALRVATINSVGDFILFLGKCTVTAITALCTTLLLKSNENIHFYAVPLIAVAILSYFIAHCIISVYEMVIDTLFICFCEDMTHNDGKTPGKEYYAPDSLRRLILSEGGDDIALASM